MGKLKSCPFCGGEAEVRKNEFGSSGYAFIACKRCGASTKFFDKSLDYSAVYEAIKSWNMRVSDELEHKVECIDMCENRAIRSWPIERGEQDG